MVKIEKEKHLYQHTVLKTPKGIFKNGEQNLFAFILCSSGRDKINWNEKRADKMIRAYVKDRMPKQKLSTIKWNERILIWNCCIGDRITVCSEVEKN